MPDKRKTDETWNKIRKRIWNRDRPRCQVCKKRILPEFYECGHIVDRVRGGSDLDDNLVAMCITCNRLKPCHNTREEYDAWVASGFWTTEMLAHEQFPVLCEQLDLSPGDCLEYIRMKRILDEFKPARRSLK